MHRSDQELDILVSISQILGNSFVLPKTFQDIISILNHHLDIQRASLLIWSNKTKDYKEVAVVDRTDEVNDWQRQIAIDTASNFSFEATDSLIIHDLNEHLRSFVHEKPEHINLSDSDIDRFSKENISFLCVPIKNGSKLVGAICIYKPCTDQDTLTADIRLLKIVAGVIGNTICAQHSVEYEKNQWLEETARLRKDLFSKYRFENIIGASPVMLEVLATIGQASSSRATCLLLGETGCGKELIAKAIHYNSPRKNQPLIRVNCGALSPQLLESELFGHVEGAFTGAIRNKIGRFEAANGGTIFLDEIGTLDPHLQVKLLRVLQEREFERVGDHRTIKTNVRIIAATNLNLEDEVRRKTFRSDLYYRLAVITINLPPLRNRRDDIPPLIDHFLDHYNKENRRNLNKLDRNVLDTLLRYPWPGNVRELENTIERAVVLSEGQNFSENLLPLQIRLFAKQVRGTFDNEPLESIAAKLTKQAVMNHRQYEGDVYHHVIGTVERQLIRQALNQNDQIRIRTARFLGINRNTLNKKINHLNASP